jgi:hypothetical protein
MAQSTGQTSQVDAARRTEYAVNVARVFPFYKVHIKAKTVEIRGFLDRYAATVSFNLRQTRCRGS